MRLPLLGIALLTATVSSAALAKSVDAAYDKHSQPVYNSHGDCVRTIWQNATDPCAPAAKEAPKPVVQVTAPPPPPAAVPEVSEEQRTIYFAFNRAAIDTDAKAKLDALAVIINDSTAIADVRIHGFTDQIGSTGYNAVLANKRAKAIKSYLDSKSRLKTTVAEVKGLGKSSPTEGCGALKARAEKISCMAKERRVEIEFKAQK